MPCSLVAGDRQSTSTPPLCGFRGYVGPFPARLLGPPGPVAPFLEGFPPSGYLKPHHSVGHCPRPSIEAGVSRSEHGWTPPALSR